MPYSCNPYESSLSRELTLGHEVRRPSGLLTYRRIGHMALSSMPSGPVTHPSGLYLPSAAEIAHFTDSSELRPVIDESRVVDTLDDLIRVASEQARTYYDRGFTVFEHATSSPAAAPIEVEALRTIAKQLERHAKGLPPRLNDADLSIGQYL